MKKAILFLWLSIFSLPLLSAQLKVSKLFSNNAVLQRGIEVPVWGTANPEDTVYLDFNGKPAQAKTDKEGKWKIVLPKMKAGGPFKMTISTTIEKISFKNILIGDVWLCSGQSNMEWIVLNSNNAKAEISQANDDQIRHFKVPHTYSLLPQDTLVDGTWETCSPKTVGDFTAVGYYFAKELRKHQNVPIGLLHSSWGGSRIEPWMRAESLGYKDAEESARSIQTYIDSLQVRTTRKLEKLLGGKLPLEDQGMKGDFPLWASPDYDHSGWKTMDVPGLWESQGYEALDGVLWFRKEFYITNDELTSSINLNLGPIDDNDITYINGQKIGGLNSYNTDRNYTISPKILNEGVNVITIRVHDTGGGGGIYGDCKKIYYKSTKGKTSLCGQWHFKVGKVEINGAAAPNQTNTLLYHYMIHPILNYPIKGALWYQGESNASIEGAKDYQKLFPTMIRDWRKLWNIGDFPFLWVQLANWQGTNDQPSDTGWARLREAQSMTLNVPNTAQAVIIDIGETNDIHPRNKQDVGLRLSLGARKIAYGENITYSGPVYQNMKIDAGKAILNFETFGSQLASRNSEDLQEFAIAGVDKKFYWAQAKIEGNKIIVWSENVQNPVAVRYAWANNPIKANLINKEGNPASPFRTDDWEVNKGEE